MKAIGMVRKVDELGRIVLPIEIRRTFDINHNDLLELYVDDDAIILKKQESCCAFCGSTTDIFIFKGKNICSECVKELQK